MTTKDTMTNTHTLALAYAEKLVEYHEAMNSDVCDKDLWVRRARDEMYVAQSALNHAAEAEAKSMV